VPQLGALPSGSLGKRSAAGCFLESIRRSLVTSSPGRSATGGFWFSCTELSTGRVSHGWRLGGVLGLHQDPPGGLSSVRSFGRAALDVRWEHLDSVATGRLVIRFDCPFRPVATPDGCRPHHTDFGQWRCRGEREDRSRWGGPTARRATVRCPRQVFGPGPGSCTGSATLGCLAFGLCRRFAPPAATSATRFGDSRTFAFTHTWKRTLLSRCLCTREQGHGRTASVKSTSSAPGRAAKTVESRGLEPQGHDGSAQPIRR
jgi:hypothetical protein